jgi:hypothetical protein
MPINMEILWQNWLMTMTAGLAILVAVVGGFAFVGFVCGTHCELCTRKEERERRNREEAAAILSWQPEEAETAPALPGMGRLSTVADVQRAASLTVPDYRR